MSGLFKPWPKTPRLNRDCVITEKLDGTNSAIHVLTEDEVRARLEGNLDYLLGYVEATEIQDVAVFAQSRNRLIRPGKSTDNYGFAAWVQENAAALALTLGPGTHYGEWWGEGVARGYAPIQGKRFSLFNTARHGYLPSDDGRLEGWFRGSGIETPEDSAVAAGLRVVPTLYRGPFDTDTVQRTLCLLRDYGSVAVPGFDRPEGIIIYHEAARQVFKVTCENDEQWKGATE